jgi:hypothetical protein
MIRKELKFIIMIPSTGIFFVGEGILSDFSQIGRIASAGGRFEGKDKGRNS